MEFLSNYGLFFAETFTFVIALLLTVLGITIIVSKEKTAVDKLTIKKLNDIYDELASTLNRATLTHKEYRQLRKKEKKAKKARAKLDEKQHKIFVLRFNGDIRASAVNNLRNEVTGILTVATPSDEVLLCLESPGGIVPNYGLAASQLQRIRDRGISLTVCIDKIAASGGYLMACVAHRILAAPFAIIGSIGVVGQLPNLNRWLKKHNVDYEMQTAGEYKRTLTMFAENTKAGRAKFQEELEDIHSIFKAYLSKNRPQLDIDKIATGEHWPASKAKELRLVDELITSDDYLLKLSNTADLYEVSYKKKKSLTDRLSTGISHTLQKCYQSFRQEEKEQRVQAI